MTRFSAQLSLLALCTAALIGCKEMGSSSIPNLPAGTTCTVATAQSSVTGTCNFPSPQSSATPFGLASSTPVATATPFVHASATPTPVATATPTPIPTPTPLSGIWQWKGLALNQGSSTQTLLGNLPYVTLSNALSGTVQLTTSSFAAQVSISSNTCPQSFNVQPSGNGGISLSVNSSVTTCGFTVTDPSSGSAITVQYSNP